MKVEKLEDLLEIDTDKNKADDNKRLLRKIKQLLKTEEKVEKSTEAKARHLPYTGVSIVGNKMVVLKFDLDSKDGTVEEVITDPRDTRGQNHMAVYNAKALMGELARNQKEKI